MVTSLVLTGAHRVDIVNGFVDLGSDEKISVKNIPFVRYKLDTYNKEELEYIKNMKIKFKHSCHMAEVRVDKDISEYLENIHQIENLVTLIYLEITDDTVKNGLNDDQKLWLSNLSDFSIDRYMIKDCSNTLNIIKAESLKKEIKGLIKLKNLDIGICSSPYSFDGRSACLTALKARELSAEYAENDEVALPTSNHECMDRCGCIKYTVISKDIIGQASVSVASKVSKSGRTSRKVYAEWVDLD